MNVGSCLRCLGYLGNLDPRRVTECAADPGSRVLHNYRGSSRNAKTIGIEMITVIDYIKLISSFRCASILCVVEMFVLIPPTW